MDLESAGRSLLCPHALKARLLPFGEVSDSEGVVGVRGKRGECRARVSHTTGQDFERTSHGEYLLFSESLCRGISACSATELRDQARVLHHARQVGFHVATWRLVHLSLHVLDERQERSEA